MKDRMLRGELYIADDPQLQADHYRASTLLERFNEEQEERDRLLRELPGESAIVKLAQVKRELP